MVVLKKLIRELVAELESLGLSPLVLQELLQKRTERRSRRLSGSASSRGRTQERQLPLCAEVEGDSQSFSSVSLSMPGQPSPPTRVVYELSDQGEPRHIVPRLRLWVEESSFPSSPLKVVPEDLIALDSVNLSTPFALPISLPTASLSIPTTQSRYISPLAKCTKDNTMVMAFPVTQHSYRWMLQESFAAADDRINSIVAKVLNNAEMVIPLTSDIALFRLLTGALNAALSTIVANTSRPASVRGRPDLYKWRTIFRLYMEAQTLMPIVPHIDDYICLICTAIAFKHIRLSCGHVFCVRCLVKMQKRGRNHYHLCRAPTVLSADQANVDRALVNFMLDWFPKETQEKDKGNRKEAAEEELKELGLDTRCTMM